MKLFRFWHLKNGQLVSLELKAEMMRDAQRLFILHFSKLIWTVPDTLWIEEYVNGKWKVIWSKL